MIKREKTVYFQREGRQQELSEYLERYCRKLYGADVYYDKIGDISYISWPSLPRDGLLPPSFTVISKLHPQANIYAPYTRYPERSELRINQIKKDQGSVEVAIRVMDHILGGEKGKETTQAKEVGKRAHELLDLFTTSFAEIPPEEFERKRQQTYTLLARVELNPETVIGEEKKRMAKWLIKGSFGEDSLERRNQLISIMALAAAYRRAIERQKGISEIVGKFARMREALIFEREFARQILEDVTKRLGPEALPAHALFKYSNKSPTNVGVVIGILNTLTFQLDQPHVKTYRTVAQEAKGLLKEAVLLLEGNNRQEIIDRGLFLQAYNLLLNELNSRKEIYQQKMIF